MLITPHTLSDPFAVLKLLIIFQRLSIKLSPYARQTFHSILSVKGLVANGCNPYWKLKYVCPYLVLNLNSISATARQ